MVYEKQGARDGEKLHLFSTHESMQLKSARTAGLAIGLFSLPLVLISIVQYIRYGFDLFLGWDTSTYVWWAELFYNGGVNYLIQISYPNIYVIILSGFGQLLGQVSVAERILPFLTALPLAYACYRLTLDITTDRTLGYLGAFLGGLAVNTLRLESDLHRNLLSFSVSMVLGALVSSQLRRQPFSWRAHWKNAFLIWLPLLAVVAYTQIETYTVLSLALLLMFSFTRNIKAAFATALLVSLPVLVALPLIYPFLLNYRSSISLIGLAPQPPLSIFADAFLFLGGIAIPWTIVGIVTIFRKAREGKRAALFVISWLVALTTLFPFALLLGLPYDRFLYVVPVPIIIASGARAILQVGPALSRRRWFKGTVGRIRQETSRKNMFPFAIALLLIATMITSTTADSFLRPYVSQQDVNRLTQVADVLRQHSYGEPILVMYGPIAADVNSIYRAYFGIEVPRNLAYYGKLQYLFTLPNPAEVYAWQYDPPFEMTSSIRYRAEILTQLGASTAISSHPIVIAGGDTYDRPLSEVFLGQFETAPGSGIYIIPPNQLQANEIDNWQLYAYSDWTAKTGGYVENSTWAQAGEDLSYVGRGIGSRFEADYSISLAQSWTNMSLRLGLYNWQQPFTFPDGTNATLAPIQVTFDHQLLLDYTYAGGRGPVTITNPVSNVTAGVHTIRIASVSYGSAMAVVVALDTIQVCPLPCV